MYVAKHSYIKYEIQNDQSSLHCILSSNHLREFKIDSVHVSFKNLTLNTNFVSQRGNVYSHFKKEEVFSIGFK